MFSRYWAFFFVTFPISLAIAPHELASHDQPRHAANIPADLLGEELPSGAVARMGTVRFRHQATVTSVTFSPDGKTLASASIDGTVRLWLTATGKEIRKLRGHQGMVVSLSYSPDGKTVASAGADQTTRLWEAATGK